ncbi:nucleotidyltransferase [Spirochaetia bacterium]|nr:nucleotidyltransferase [Spirochaetia bacterium]
MGGPILVVMAAGMGSRYGGLKQMDKIGKNGEVLLDYSVFDALRSGFTKVVFIIRHDIEKDFRDLVLARLGSQVNCEIAFQERDSLVPEDIYKRVTALGRTKPWGTAHALLCAAPYIDAPFAVLNADDFYGREAFAVLGKYLADPASKDAAIVPYKLEPTLSPQGTVTRGFCEIKDGYLTSVNELLAIGKKDGRIINTNPDGTIRELAPDAPVSMNFWGFPPQTLSRFREYFDNFLKDFANRPGGELKAECYLPLAADWFIQKGYVRIKALEADSHWFGVTYKEDREAAIACIAELTAAGKYPAALWK